MQEPYKLIYAELINKWPISNREVVYVLYTKEENGTYFIFEKSLDAPDVPVAEGLVRANMINGFKFTPLSENSCKVSFFSHFDPVGPAPGFAKNKIQTGWCQNMELIIRAVIGL